jgi:hypothetical protein
MTTDVSHKGFCLELPTLLEAKTEIDGYVLYGDKELPFKGEVAWVRRGDPQASLWHRTGVRFTWVCPGLRALLSIRQAQRKQAQRKR